MHAVCMCNDACMRVKHACKQLLSVIGQCMRMVCDARVRHARKAKNAGVSVRVCNVLVVHDACALQVQLGSACAASVVVRVGGIHIIAHTHNTATCQCHCAGNPCIGSVSASCGTRISPARSADMQYTKHDKQAIRAQHTMCNIQAVRVHCTCSAPNTRALHMQHRHKPRAAIHVHYTCNTRAQCVQCRQCGGSAKGPALHGGGPAGDS